MTGRVSYRTLRPGNPAAAPIAYDIRAQCGKWTLHSITSGGGVKPSAVVKYVGTANTEDEVKSLIPELRD